MRRERNILLACFFCFITPSSMVYVTDFHIVLANLSGPQEQFIHSMDPQLRQLGLPTSLKKGIQASFEIDSFFLGGGISVGGRGEGHCAHVLLMLMCIWFRNQWRLCFCLSIHFGPSKSDWFVVTICCGLFS